MWRDREAGRSWPTSTGGTSAWCIKICLMLMKNVPDAEDAAQNVFRKVMEYDQPFRDPEHEKV